MGGMISDSGVDDDGECGRDSLDAFGVGVGVVVVAKSGLTVERFGKNDEAKASGE